MKSNTDRRFAAVGQQPQPLIGVKVEVLTNQKLNVVPSSNMNPQDPQHLQTMMDMLATAISVLAEKWLMEMEGDGKEAVKDAVVAHCNSIKALTAKHMPRLEGKMIMELPKGPMVVN